MMSIKVHPCYKSISCNLGSKLVELILQLKGHALAEKAGASHLCFY